MARPASGPGRLLERRGDAAPRGMAVHDRTRLTGRLRPFPFPCRSMRCLVARGRYSARSRPAGRAAGSDCAGSRCAAHGHGPGSISLPANFQCPVAAAAGVQIDGAGLWRVPPRPMPMSLTAMRSGTSPGGAAACAHRSARCPFTGRWPAWRPWPDAGPCRRPVRGATACLSTAGAGRRGRRRACVHCREANLPGGSRCRHPRRAVAMRCQAGPIGRRVSPSGMPSGPNRRSAIQPRPSWPMATSVPARVP